MGVMSLNEFNMEGLDDLVGRTMVESVGFRVRGIANQDAFIRACIDFRVMLVLNEDKGPATYFTEVGEVWFRVKPGFKWSLSNSSSWRLGAKVRGGDC